MTFPGCVVQCRELLFIQDAGIRADVKKRSETGDISFASSMHKRSPSVELVYLVQVCSIVLEKKEELRRLPRPGHKVLRVEPFGVGQ
jgi:hypothetical protein